MTERKIICTTAGVQLNWTDGVGTAFDFTYLQHLLSGGLVARRLNVPAQLPALVCADVAPRRQPVLDRFLAEQTERAKVC